jgi:hypothetical protein
VIGFRAKNSHFQPNPIKKVIKRHRALTALTSNPAPQPAVRHLIGIALQKQPTTGEKTKFLGRFSLTEGQNWHSVGDAPPGSFDSLTCGFHFSMRRPRTPSTGESQ